MADPALESWLRLTLIPGVGAETQRQLLAAFGLPENIFTASPSALGQVAGRKAALLRQDNQEAVQQALAWARQPGNHIVTLADAEYPRRLLESADPPCLLYVKGRLELLNRPALAIVGSRNATPQGLQDGEALARELADAGLTIISGLALGIDGATHRGGLAGLGSSIAVVGTGADRIYPSRHDDLARQLARDGAIISEFPLGTPPVGHNFPKRNRIIAAMGLGCLVVEAALESGSLITARLAADLGRDVFAVPGSIHSPLSRGCHRLLKQGAKLVETARDIVEEIGPFAMPAGPATAAAPAEPLSSAPTDGQRQALLAALGHDPVHLDLLLQRTGLTTETLCAMLVALELDGQVAVLPGSRYQQLFPQIKIP